MNMGKEIQKVEKLNKATIEFTSELRKLARTFAKVACLRYQTCERDFEEE